MERRFWLLLLLLFPSLPAGLLAGEPGTDGFLFLPSYIDGDNGTVSPLRVESAETGQPVELRSVESTLSPGNQYALPAGRYHVQMGQFENQANRRLYRVEAGKVTVIRTGVVTVALPTPVGKVKWCPGWSQNLTAHVAGPEGYAAIAADVNFEEARYGRLQLHAGDYLLEWNGIFTRFTVEAEKILLLTPVTVAPIIGVTKARLRQAPLEGLSRAGSLAPCTGSPLYLLPGDYTLEHRLKTNEYPFYRVQEDPVPVKRPERFAVYRSLHSLRGKADRYRGKEGQGEPVPAVAAPVPPAPSPVEEPPPPAEKAEP